MDLNATFDMRGYSRFVEGLQNALIGTGQDGDMALVCKVEARQLALGIAGALGPKSKEAGAKKIEKDIRKEFAPGPAQIFEASKRKSRVFETGITWLYAGPSFLVGVRDEDFQPQMGVDAMRKQFTAARTAGFPRGNVQTALGMRGQQGVVRWNRAIVSKERFAALENTMFSRVGRLKAMFAFTAYKLGAKRIPAWVHDQFSKVEADGTAIFRFVGTGPNFAIEFGARAPGVASNPHIQKAIHGQVELRKHKLLEKIKKVLIGYTYDWNTGAVFRPHRGEQMMRELEANEELFDSL